MSLPTRLVMDLIFLTTPNVKCLDALAFLLGDGSNVEGMGVESLDVERLNSIGGLLLEGVQPDVVPMV